MRWNWVIGAALLAATPAAAQTVKAGIDAWSRGDYAAALSIWRPLAARGDADAMFNLGQVYRLGRGVPIDLGEAVDWYSRAARAGHLDAQTQLGILLFQNERVIAGLRWLKIAADRGEPRAQLLYGTALYNGDGSLPRDPLAGYAYVARAAAQGFGPARSSLAEMERDIPANLRRVALGGSNARRAEVPKVVEKPATSAATASGGWRVQLGAFSQRSAAQALFRKHARGALAGKQSYLVPVGSMTRLQAGPFASREAASAVCATLVSRGQACFPVAAR